ncbi:MAG: OmpA family protein [Sphingomonadales bacterium]|nr:OmpA family protein [Sphingomonadales bacterium]
MRKLVIGLALASTAMATPALARDKSWYVEGDAGGVIVENIFNITGSNNNGTLDTKPGYDFGGIVGYDFGAFRLEAEASYRRAEEKKYTAGATTVGDALVGGGAEALSFMGNALLDFGPDDGLQGFVGAGAGVGRVKNAVLLTKPNTTDLVDSDTGFAWQALAGVRMPISDHIDFGLKYRYYQQNHNDLVNNAGKNVRTRFRSHSLLGTLTYNFGGAPAPAPEPVAPPPPPPPPVVAPVAPPPAPICNKGPYIVFFDWDKSDITPEAASILDSAVSAYGNCANVPIMLAGYADRSGTPRYNQGLSERRNTSVRGYLTSHGVADGAITSQGFGENNNRVPTADGVRELQNRRVEITYGPGSGN